MAEEKLDTGLCDSNGTSISVGSRIKKPVDCNTEMHGNWAIYEVRLQGIVPILSYIRSEKGDVLPVGYTASVLSDEYDQKLFVFAKNSQGLRPENNIEVIN